jgi:predicted molibdopterin-dependent oxidoreductase YjgC
MGEMTEDMSRLWERFNLMEEEDEEVMAPEVEVEPMVNRGNACVVGKLLADRSVGKEVIRTPLIRA